MTKPIDYAGPTGRELPGEHWNARIIREQRQASLLGFLEMAVKEFSRNPVYEEEPPVVTWRDLTRIASQYGRSSIGARPDEFDDLKFTHLAGLTRQQILTRWPR